MLDYVINGGAEGACLRTAELRSHITLITCLTALECGVVLHHHDPRAHQRAPPPLFSSL